MPKKKTLTFVISLLHPICSFHTGRKANVWEEKDFRSKYEPHLSNTQSASLLLIIRHDEMNWNAPCRIDPSAGDILFYKQRR